MICRCYTYDVWGNKKSVKIGNQNLETYSYNPNNGLLFQKTYENGSTEKYSYNAYGQISKINKVSLGDYQFNYDSKGTPVYTRDNVGQFRTYYKYDKQGRNAGVHIVSTINSNAYANDVYDSSVTYTTDGKVSKSSFTSAYNSVKNNYSYAQNTSGNDTAVSTFTSSRGVNSVYNDDGNIISRTITTNTPFVQSYIYNDDGKVSSETRGDKKYSYTYDGEGRITEVKVNNTVRQSYVYDSEGQLIRENNLDINKTTVYNYDG